MKRFAACEADRDDIERLMARREAGINRLLSLTLLYLSIAFAICLVCSLTRVFLTGCRLGVAAFLPGIVLMLSGSSVARRFDRGERPLPWVKYYMCSVLALAILSLSLIQLVWSVPLIIGGITFVYSYMNMRMVVLYTSVTLMFLALGAGMNALWGMPNPDMVPYPESVQGIQDGYVTLWAMEHREAWSQWEYFLRILRFHTLPMAFLLMCVAGCGFAMVGHGRRLLIETLERMRRVREVEACLLLMAGGNQSQELIQAVLGDLGSPKHHVPPLSQAFVDSIPAETIPSLMREFRRRCLSDTTFEARAVRDPESALRSILLSDSLT